MAFPKLPDLIQPPPAGPTFDPTTYQKLVTDTLAPGQAALDGLEAEIAAMAAITAAGEADVDGWVSDLDLVDAAINDFDVLDWGSPEPDLAVVDTYLAAQRDSILGQITNAPPIATVPLVTPTGGTVLTLSGGGPSGGGPPTLGNVVIHITRNIAVQLAVVAVSVQRTPLPNPPFAALAVTGFTQFRSLCTVHADLTINPNVAQHGTENGDVILRVHYSNGTTVDVVLPLQVTI